MVINLVHVVFNWVRLVIKLVREVFNLVT